LQTVVILVAGPFMLVLIAKCLSKLKSLREGPYESTLPPHVRRAVHAQRHDRLAHQSIAVATLGGDGPYDGELSISAAPKVGKTRAQRCRLHRTEKRVSTEVTTIFCSGSRGARRGARDQRWATSSSER
jgi:hypothetical protein